MSPERLVQALSTQLLSTPRPAMQEHLLRVLQISAAQNYPGGRGALLGDIARYVRPYRSDDYVKSLLGTIRGVQREEGLVPVQTPLFSATTGALRRLFARTHRDPVTSQPAF